MSSIIKAKAYNGGLVVVNLDMLKNNKRLIGATIFNRLFCLEDDDDENAWGPNKLNVDKDGHLTILSDYKITSKDWFNFTNFLQLGITDHYIVAYTPGLTQSEAYKKLFLQSLNSFYFEGVPAKFGPIPALDEYYENIKKIEEENRINKNPITPEEDKDNLFLWDICAGHTTEKFSDRNKNLSDEYKWSFASQKNGIYYYRKRRKLNEEQ